MGLSGAVRQKTYRETHRAQVREAKRKCPSYRAGRNRRNKRYNANNKLIVLAHYGLEGKVQCVWPECSITDVDMLSLDHVQNDGNIERCLDPNNGAGCNLYRRLKVAGFPKGFQTLCHNHQWKKELLRRRGQ